MKIQLMKKCALVAAMIGMGMLSLSASAEMKVQNSMFKESKSAIYLKGKTSAQTDMVYVLDARSMALIGTVEVTEKQFRADIPVTAGSVPCMIQVQTTPPRRRSRAAPAAASAGPGDFTVVAVRHAGDHCS